MHVQVPIALFLDVDALLAHATFQSCRAAADAFGALDQHNVAVILCSGATRAELDYLSRALDIWHPFICEDGSAICIPQGYFGRPVPEAKLRGSWEIVEFGRAHRGVVDTVSLTAARLGVDIVALNELSPARAAAEFGWPLSLARRAVKRQYGDVFRLQRPDPFARARLVRTLRREQLRCTRRGLANYVVPETGGSAAVLLLRRMFEEYCHAVHTLGLLHREPSGLVGPNVGGSRDVDCADLQELAAVALDAAATLRATAQTVVSWSGDDHRRPSPGHC